MATEIARGPMAGCLFDRGLWVKSSGDRNTLLVGLDTRRLEDIGELAYIQCAAVGTRVARGQPMGSLEAAKMTDTLLAPVSGVIAAVNDEAMRCPASVNRDPFGAGWLVMIIPDRWQEEAPCLQQTPPGRDANNDQQEPPRVRSTP